MGSEVILIIVFPFAGAALSLLAGVWNFHRAARLCAFVSLLGSLTMLILVAANVDMQVGYEYAVGAWEAPVGISIRFDALAIISSGVFLTVALFTLIYTFSDRSITSTFYFLFLILVGGMLGMVGTDDLFNMFVFIEVVSIASLVLIAYKNRPLQLVASLRYLILSSIGVLFFLLGVFLVYKTTGTVSLSMARNIYKGGGLELQRAIAVGFLVSGVGVKAAFLPFHTWLPDAHSAAPHPVSAMLSGVMIKVSILCVFRILISLGLPRLASPFLWIGLATALLGAGKALCQTDVKRILAYSSIAQMGLIVAAFGTGNDIGRVASLYHIMSHAFSKSLLFLIIGCVVSATGTRDLTKMSGLARELPVLSVLFLVGVLAITGMPFLGGFVSKSLIQASLMNVPARVLVTAASVGTLAAFLRLSRVFFSKPTAACRPILHEIRASHYLACIGLSLCCIAAGVFPATITAVLNLTTFTGKSIVSANGPSLAKIVQTSVVIAVGLVVYLLTRWKKALTVMNAVRAYRVSLEDALILTLTGIFGITLWNVYPLFIRG